MARLVRNALQVRGYGVFMDVEDLKSGPFKTALLSEIESSSDVVVILTPNSLDHCHDEGDWLRTEVSHAIKHGKNVIPVMTRGFKWPASLPDDIAALPNLEGLEPSLDLFDASMDRLARLLTSTPVKPEGVATASRRAKSIMKWITGATAVFALVFSVIQMVRLISDARDRRRQIDELVRVETMQKRGGDYERALASLNQAVKIAESGGLLAKLTGHLNSEARDLRIAQEDLAMAWLEHVRPGSNQGFSDIVDRLSPIVTRGATEAGGPRKADLLAHLGWASFLRSRDGKPSADPEQYYRDAFAVDTGNPYAHAYLGHWLLWTHRPLKDGKTEFQAALASGRARDYVRMLELAAMKNRGAEGDPERVAIVNDMRKNNEAINADTRSELYGIYTQACGYREDSAAMRALVAAAPPTEQAATVHALLVDAPDSDPGRRATSEACLAALFEAAGDRNAAIATWRAVIKDAPSGDPNGLIKRAEAAIRRLGAVDRG
jgi:hypothetical protein